MYKLYAKIRDEKGLKDIDVARKAGFPRSCLTSWKQGVSKPKYENLMKIADVLGVSVEYLMTGGKAISTTNGVSIPILGFVAAGIPVSAITDIIGEVTISPAVAKKGEHFALKIHGDSMEPLINDGDIVVVRSQQTADSGDIVIAQVDGDQATCKKVMLTGAGIVLRSLNPKYEPMVFSAEEIENLPVRIIGKVIESRRVLE